MSIAVRELRRQHGQFLPVLVAMTLLVVLLVVLGAFLDGLSRSQTGVLRAQGDRLLVLSEDADLAPARSRLPDGAVDALAQVDGTDASDDCPRSPRRPPATTTSPTPCWWATT